MATTAVAHGYDATTAGGRWTGVRPQVWRVERLETCCFSLSVCRVSGQTWGKPEKMLLMLCWFWSFCRAFHSIPFHSFSKAHCVAFVQMIDLQAVLLASSINLWNTEIWGYVNTITFNYHVWGGPITIHKSKLFWNILTTMLLLPLTQVGWSIVTSVVLDGC